MKPDPKRIWLFLCQKNSVKKPLQKQRFYIRLKVIFELEEHPSSDINDYD
jgi:hypothetical protein